MNKAYKRINWENYPSDATPLNEANLNNLDSATDTIDDRVITLDTTKATKTEVATLVSDVTFEESTGIITITKKNGSKFTIDTQMEKIAVNFDYNPTTEQIVLTLIDGTKQYIELSALITQYEFLDTDTVAFTIGTDGKVSAIVKEGSIKEEHLEPNYLAKVKVEVAKAQTSASNAATSEDNARSAATEAQASATAAATSKSNAQTSAAAAAQSESNAKASMNVDIDERIWQLQEEQKEIGQKVADQEQILYMLEEFIRFKLDKVSETINSHFKTVNFKLFEMQLNGGMKDCCECTVNGVGYSDLNNGHKILAGLDIIRSLSGLYGVSCPIFVDNAESLTSNYTSDSQLVLLIAKKPQYMDESGDIRDVDENYDPKIHKLVYDGSLKVESM